MARGFKHLFEIDIFKISFTKRRVSWCGFFEFLGVKMMPDTLLSKTIFPHISSNVLGGYNPGEG